MNHCLEAGRRLAWFAGGILALVAVVSRGTFAADNKPDEGTIETQIANLTAKELYKHNEAAIWLSRKGPAAVAASPKLIDMMFKASPTQHRAAAAYALGKIGAKDAVGPLAEAVRAKRDGQPGVFASTDSVRAFAAGSLGDLGAAAKDAVPALTDAARKDSDKLVRAFAALALGRIAGKDAAVRTTLGEIAASDPSGLVRLYAKAALEGKEPVVPPTVVTIKDEKNGFAEAAVTALAGDTINVVMPYRPYAFKASGTTYFIAPGGNDANDGGKDKPWATFKNAVSHLQPGDVLYVRGGDYAEPFVMNKAGQSGKPIIISAFPGETVRIYPPAMWQQEHFHEPIISVQGGYVWLHGLTVEGCVGRPDMCPNDMYGQNCVTVANDKGVRILNCVLSRALHCGIKGCVEIAEGNIIPDNGLHVPHDHAIYSYGKGSIIRGNVALRNKALGFNFDSAETCVYNNICAENGAYGMYISHDKNTVAHNAFVNNGAEGVMLFRETCRDNILVNNLLLNNRGCQLSMDDTGHKGSDPKFAPSGNTIDHLCAFPAANWASPKAWFEKNIGKTILLEDPRVELLDAKAGRYDLRLNLAKRAQDSSPCRGQAGKVKLMGVVDDFNWPDIGLFPATLYKAD